MAIDKELTARFRALLERQPGLSEKKMMGGTCFFINGNMVGGADCSKTGERRFMFRVGKPNVDEAEQLQGGEAMHQGGKLMTGFYFVNADEQAEAVIQEWLELAVQHAAGLPAK